jgi:hypothetical protein
LAMVGNIQLRCRAHNQYEAALFFGERFLVREQPACYSAVRRTCSGTSSTGLRTRAPMPTDRAPRPTPPSRASATSRP